MSQDDSISAFDHSVETPSNVSSITPENSDVLSVNPTIPVDAHVETTPETTPESIEPINSEKNEIITESLIPEPPSPPTNWSYTLLSIFVVFGCYFSNLSF